MNKNGKAGVLLMLLMTVFVLPLFAADQTAPAVSTTVKQAGIEGILQPTTNSLTQVSAYLPKLGVLLLILVIGALAAVGIAALVAWISKLIKFETVCKKIKIPGILKKGGIGLSPGELITEIVFFVIIIVTLITALEYHGVGTAGLTGQILTYIPQVIAAMFILILGILLSLLISGIIKLVGGNVKIAQSDTLGNVAKYAIIVVSALIALKELGLGVILTDKSKDIILAGLVLGLALSFGLAGKEKAGKFLSGLFKE